MEMTFVCAFFHNCVNSRLFLRNVRKIYIFYIYISVASLLWLFGICWVQIFMSLSAVKSNIRIWASFPCIQMPVNGCIHPRWHGCCLESCSSPLHYSLVLGRKVQRSFLVFRLSHAQWHLNIAVVQLECTSLKAQPLVYNCFAFTFH